MHIAVLQKEVLEYLSPQKNENFIDGTVGFAGHTKSILEKIKPNGRVLGFEIDKELFEKLEEQNIERLVMVNDSYINLKKIVEKNNFTSISGILFDLGMSSWHVDASGRGFTFQKNEPLDMRFSEVGSQTASGIISQWPAKDIADILREYGDERFSQRIAQSIVRVRRQKPIKTTKELVEIVEQAIPKKFQRGKIHPATKTFQALRIAVNSELENIGKVLPQALEVIEKGGRIVVISFHSAEDRIVKNFFRDNKQAGLLNVLTKKPVTPTAAEIQKNPRSRSAKLRAAIKK